MRPGALSALLEELVRTPASPPGSAWDGALRPGLVIGRFELVREVGRGGFGVVYEARDRELGRTVAFKAICAGDRPDVREERLLQEAEAAARLSPRTSSPCTTSDGASKVRTSSSSCCTAAASGLAWPTAGSR